MGILEAVQNLGVADVIQATEDHPSRIHAIAPACTIGIGAWYWMQIVHECGHAALAVATGGRVVRLSLPFLSFSRTDIDPNPHPLAVAWGGPIVGVVLPVLMWIVAARFMPAIRNVLAYWAGFCLVANGSYLGIGSLDNIGDAGDLASHGSARWPLWLFFLTCVPTGLWIWHCSIARWRAQHARNSRPRTSLLASAAFLGSALAVCLLARRF